MTNECARCERDEIEIRARGLCGTCYQAMKRAGRLDDYPLPCDIIDEVQVDRATEWLIGTYENTPPHERRRAPGRPILSRSEKVAVLDRVHGQVPPWVAAEALGIGGRYSRRYLEAAGVIA